MDELQNEINFTFVINILDLFEDCYENKKNRNLQFIICGWAASDISNGLIAI